MKISINPAHNPKNKTMKDFYEKFHGNGIINPMAEFMQQERCDCLRFLLRDMSGHVSIIGCGSQEEMSIINEKCDGFGIDISEVAIKKSRKKYPKSRYCISDATELPLRENSFDCVICSEVIEHVEDSEKLLSEVRRILRNGGIFIVTTPNWISWYGLLRKIAEKVLRKPFTAGNQPIDNWATPYSLKRKLMKYGFDIELFMGIWYYPPTGKGRKQFPSFIIYPLFKSLYRLENLCRRKLPWFGHIILFKAELKK